ncbi:hypothetical protein [Rubrivirga sp. IMCC45206]|uniref:hypothetical protein n=1 Tax=Rubrivirga sp. IMCC45206 TaxID=3391614 RepID=UPI00398FAFDA
MRAILPLAAALLATVFVASPARGQSTVYVQLDYIAVPAGAESAYLALERDIWRPIHAERQRRGHLLNWQLYDVMYAPPGLDYDYVTANVYGDLVSAELDELDDVIRAALPGQDPEAVLDGTRATREIVHSELWALVTSLGPTGQDGPQGRHLALNFMAAPEAGRAEYFAVENSIWAPIHQVRADDGSMGGWALYSLVLPRGSALDYQFGTVDFFDDIDSAAAGITDAQISQAHPDRSQAEIDAMMDRTDASRTIYKTELWTVIAGLGAPDG